MACDIHGNMIICSRNSGKKLGACQECGHNQATQLCDGPHASVRGKTCDKALCLGCATHVVPDRDYCAAHKDPATRRLAL